MQLNNNESAVISIVRVFLKLKLELLRRLRGEGHVVLLSDIDNGNKSAETVVTGLFAQPIPLSPSVCDSCITSTLVGKIDRPHDSGLKVSSNVLILEHAEVQAVLTHVGVHRGGESAALVGSDHAVVGDDGAGEAEDSARPVLDQIVLESGADHVAAASEPAEEGLAGNRSSQVAVSVAVDALGSEEVGVADLIEAASVGGEDEVRAAEATKAGVGLSEAVEGDVDQEALAVVDGLLADHIETGSVLGG